MAVTPSVSGKITLYGISVPPPYFQLCLPLPHLHFSLLLPLRSVTFSFPLPIPSPCADGNPTMGFPNVSETNGGSKGLSLLSRRSHTGSYMPINQQQTPTGITETSLRLSSFTSLLQEPYGSAGGHRPRAHVKLNRSDGSFRGSARNPPLLSLLRTRCV